MSSTTTREGIDLETVDVPLADILVSSPNVRPEFDESSIRELAESIRLEGLLAAPGFFREGSRYVPLFGYRRIAAARLLGWESVPGRIFEEPKSEADRILIQLSENEARADLTPLAAAAGYAALAEAGLKQEEIAARCGVAVSTVSRLIGIHEGLIEEGKQRLRRGAISLTVARAVSRLKAEDQPMMLERAIRWKLTADRVEELVRQALGAVIPDRPKRGSKAGNRGLHYKIGPHQIRVGRRNLTIAFTDGRSKRPRTKEQWLEVLTALVERMRREEPDPDRAPELVAQAEEG